MRLLQTSDTCEFSLTKDFGRDDTIPPYAILSHTWKEGEEVTFQDLINGTGQEKNGYNKIRFCGQQAKRDDLQHFWVDTCCIDRTNPGELREALNSMFRWYQNAVKCYVYLSDVSIAKRKASDGVSEIAWEPAFRVSRWFTRGWTLQELLASSSLEFFSQEWKKLGDKRFLTQQLHKITGIPKPALEGAPLSQFSINDRLSWIENRQTKLEEDKAYSLLGILDAYIPPIYGEGMVGAFKRLMDEIDKRDKCIQDLHLTDPRDDKKRIEETKGGLLEDSYRWILEDSDFQQWRDNPQSRVLWIKGDPGKGKTMLLCGIINELSKSMTQTSQASYFFCQATDPRINTATAVLRGLLYLLVNQQPSLVSYIRKKHDYAGKVLFEDTNTWTALSDIFTNILQDPSLKNTNFIVDALDECLTGLPKLLDFIVQTSCVSSRVKWIVSSRNWPNIEERLERVGQKVKLSLELNATSVSNAVRFYIQHRVAQLALEKNYKEKEKSAVLAYLTSNAKDTFLWVALVCQNLSDIPRWKVLAKLEAFPPGLDALYDRMMQHICGSDDADLCKSILALIATVYRPITIDELTALSEELVDMADELDSVREIIGLCGSFLTIRHGAVYFVHQSAKDFLCTKAVSEIFPSGTEEVHFAVFERSLEVMAKTLRRDMYSLRALGYPAEQVQPPYPDPLAASRYSCIYWVDHLCDWNPNQSTDVRGDLQYEGAVDSFLRSKYLYWLEALSLCKSVSEGVVAMAKLEAFIQGKANASAFIELVWDARRFIMYHKGPIEKNPLQAYASALLFSPVGSIVRALYKEEEPKWITIESTTEDKWSACLQTLECHGNWGVRSVAFSHDSAWLASASHNNMDEVGSGEFDSMVKIWEVSSGKCIQTLGNHSHWIKSVAFSHDSAWLASASSDGTIKIWDMSSGECLKTLKGNRKSVDSVAFSPDSSRLASVSGHNSEVWIWDANSGECLKILEVHSNEVCSTAFSYNSAWLALASHDDIIKIWDTNRDKCLQTLMGHSYQICSMAFSYDSTRLASASYYGTVKIWDTSSGKCLYTLKGHSQPVNSLAFTHDSTWLASGSDDNTVKIWDINSGKCLQKLKGHGGSVYSLAFSHDSALLASGSRDQTVKIWDVTSGGSRQTLEGHSGMMAFSYDSSHGEYHGDQINSVAFSHDSTRLVSASNDTMIKIWDTSSGECLQTLSGHSDWINLVVFSHDSTRLASASSDTMIKIWDTSSGECLQTLSGHSDWINSVVFSHDSTRLASASDDKMIKIWDTSSGECLRTLNHDAYYYSLAFSHDSARLASCANDGLVNIWNVSTGKSLHTLSIGHTSSSISFDITDSYLHTDIGTIDISALLRLNILSTISEPQNPQYRGLALSSDGLWITYDSENMVWLPSEYRPFRAAVVENMIGIGVETGRVWICKLNLTHPDALQLLCRDREGLGSA